MSEIRIYLTEEDIQKLNSGEWVDIPLDFHMDNVDLVSISKE